MVAPSAIIINGLSFDNLSHANLEFEQDLEQLKGKSAISPPESLKLIRDYNEREIYRAFGSTSAELIAEDDARRYSIEKDVAVAMPDRARNVSASASAIGNAASYEVRSGD